MFKGRFPGLVTTLRRGVEKRVLIRTGPGGEVGVELSEVIEDYIFSSECHQVLEPMLDKRIKPIHAVPQDLVSHRVVCASRIGT